MGIVLAFACIIAAFFFWFKALYNAFWRYAGPGQRQARAEHARILRESPNSPDGKISEAEYVNSYLKRSHGFLKYFVLALLVSMVGVPLSCAWQVSSM